MPPPGVTAVVERVAQRVWDHKTIYQARCRCGWLGAIQDTYMRRVGREAFEHRCPTV